MNCVNCENELSDAITFVIKNNDSNVILEAKTVQLCKDCLTKLLTFLNSNRLTMKVKDTYVMSQNKNDITINIGNPHNVVLEGNLVDYLAFLENIFK